MIFETHAHYDDEAFEQDREALLESMQQQGVGYIVNSCASIENMDETIELTRKYPFIYCSVGVHPDDAGNMTQQVLDRVRSLCSYEKTVAVGEIGLDYYWDKALREVQKKWFRAQLEIAEQEKLPFVIHSRDAAEDTLAIMKEMKAGQMSGGIIHCFSYSVEIAREYLNMGLYLGIGGVVTFKNARKLKEVVEYAPLEQLVLETDSPYLAPVPNRGKRNSSLNLCYVAEEIAQIKGISAKEVEQITFENAKRLFKKIP